MNLFASKFVTSALNGDDMLKNYWIKCLTLFIPCVMSGDRLWQVSVYWCVCGFCRSCSGPSVSRHHLSHRLEQRLLHAHLCWRLSLPGQKHYFIQWHHDTARLLAITAYSSHVLDYLTVLINVIFQPAHLSTTHWLTFFLSCFCRQFLSRLVYKEAQGWCRRAPRVRG